MLRGVMSVTSRYVSASFDPSQCSFQMCPGSDLCAQLVLFT